MTGHSDRADADIRRFAPKWAGPTEGEGGKNWFPQAEPANQNVGGQVGEISQLTSPIGTADAVLPSKRTTIQAERPPLSFEKAEPLRSATVVPRSGLGIFGLLGVVVLTATMGTAGGLLLIRRSPPAAEPPLTTNVAAPSTSAPAMADPARPDGSHAPHLVLAASPSPASVDPLPLGVGVTNAPAGATVVVGSLPEGWTLSSGTSLAPSGWQVPVNDLAAAMIRPPPHFAGALDLALELRLADDTVVDRSSMRREWTGVASAAAAVPRDAATSPASGLVESLLRGPVRQLPPDEIESFLVRGHQLLRNGDAASARLLFQRAAQARDPRAALAIASTYDPFILRELGLHGLASDVALARSWYEVARELGSRDAQERLNALASQDPH